jgi:hypothetical protein
MRFEIGSEPASFVYHGMTGRTDLVAGGRLIELQNLTSLGTHYSLGLVKTFEVEVDGHRVEIQMTRKRWLAGFRDVDVVIAVEGVEVARASGR